MFNKGNYKQGEKAAFRVPENDSKWNNQQRINLQNTQAAYAAQYKKKWTTNQKVSQGAKETFLQRRHTNLINKRKVAQHDLLSEKCK